MSCPCICCCSFPVIYLKYGTKKIRQLKKISPNIFQFKDEKFFSKEESIGRSFSLYNSSRYWKFITSILPALTIFDYKTTMLFLQDTNFIQSLDRTKEEFENIYKLIKNPSKYSSDSQIASLVREFFQRQV